MSEVLVSVSVTEAIGVTAALISISFFMLWISFKYNDSEEVWLGVISQLFHGFGIVMWLPIMYVAYESSTTSMQDVLGPVLAVLGLLLFVYAMLMILRVVWGIIIGSVHSARRFVGFGQDKEMDYNSKIRGGGGFR